MKNFEYYTSPKSNIKEIIPIALEKLNWNYDRNESHYTVKFPINLYTWGSIMDIKIIKWKIDEEIYMEELEHHHLKSPVHQHHEK